MDLVITYGNENNWKFIFTGSSTISANVINPTEVKGFSYINS